MSRNSVFSVFDIVFYAPIVEELIFRVFLFSLVARFSNALFSSLYISFIFAIGHEYDLDGTLSSFVVALIWQWLFVRYRCISICIISHMFFNAFGIVGRTYFGG
jgi:membrane protease YdiL (CAAX protease family)